MKPTHTNNPLHIPLHHLPTLIWHFTESNFPTFVLPNSAFGFLGALSGPALTTSHTTPDLSTLLPRLPLIILFNWALVFIFDLANQRLPESIHEDHLNKPWRPLPTKRITADQTRRPLLATIPIGLGITYTLDVWQETCPILILTWMYNDLKGGDELIRDGIIAVAYGLYNIASLKIACTGDEGVEPSEKGYLWTVVISGVILTTMQIQDLKDVEGDRTRGRQTIPLAFGEGWSRWSIVGFVVGWSVLCVWFWGLEGWVLMGRTVEENAAAWRLWCVWLMVLYGLPCLKGMEWRGLV
ncbi:hypothetical protein ASPTUDRAFT_188542 [Aspergillus tubingensis CBS 134.48]|uniref:Digeranylgeranylglyceryl phosphate synthase protein n=1 Tax=Aspergillus tubingensis (strain CBS 134.48) TaxID=767770 RepID=A0A1L9ND49_ASPTC|nr:hypothetical protein ASPTUDRAFT_188542 [Aspergillus tubingensis CBS 134.48]